MLLDDCCEEVEQESSDTAVGKSNGMVSKQPASTQILKEGQLSKFFHIITNVHYTVFCLILYSSVTDIPSRKKPSLFYYADPNDVSYLCRL